MPTNGDQVFARGIWGALQRMAYTICRPQTVGSYAEFKQRIERKVWLHDDFYYDASITKNT